MSKLIEAAQLALKHNDPQLAAQVDQMIDQDLAARLGMIIETVDNALTSIGEQLEGLENLRGARPLPEWRTFIDAVTNHGYRHLIELDRVVSAGRRVYCRRTG